VNITQTKFASRSERAVPFDDFIKYIIDNKTDSGLVIIMLFVIGEHRIIDARIDKNNK